MHLKSLILDGFKSYSRKTEIGPFDESFNAITGLNGSGKSNIFDAICFVLGISNLGSVRASSIQDLVYKNGKAGVTKAVVVLILDNKDKSRSPLNYGSFDEISVSREVVVGGRTKYLMNGKNVTNSHVHDFFKLVGLNVNCPHFLIMQGQITKVLNMQPQDHLATIEEASATKLYAEKRENYIKMASKKELKLHEIDEKLENNLLPGLKKYEEDRKAYIHYQDVVRSIEKLSKYETIAQLKTANEREQSLNQKIQSILSNRNEIQKSLELDEQAKAEIEHEKDGLMSQIKSCETDEKKALTDKYSDLKMQVASLNSDMTILASEKADVEKEIEQTIKYQKNEVKEMEHLNQKLEKMQSSDLKGNNDRLAYESLLEKIKSLEDELKLICTGQVTNSSGKLVSLQSEILTLKNTVTDIKMQINCKKSKSEALQKKLKNYNSTLQKFSESDIETAKKNISDNETKLQALKEKIEQSETIKGEFAKIESSLILINKDSEKLQRELYNIKSSNYSFNFKYSKPPANNFDPKNVIGMVYELFRVKDSKFNKALESISGARLFNVVVENDATASMLLKFGNLKFRTNFLPLNKLQAYCIPERAIQKAKSVCGPSIYSALELLDFDKKYTEVMKFVFGSTLICETMQQGKQIAFNPEIKCNVVTLDGEFFSCQGTLSGGSVDRSSKSLLSVASSIHAIIDRMNDNEATQNSLNSQLVQLKSKLTEFEKYRDEYQALGSKLSEHKSQFSGYYEAQESISDCENQRASLAKEITELSEKLTQTQGTLDSYETKVSDAAKSEKDAEDLKKQIKQLQAKEKKLKSSMQSDLEIFEQLKTQITVYSKNIQEFDQKISELKEKVSSIEANLKKIESNPLNEEIKAIESQLKEIDIRSSHLSKQIELFNNKLRQIEKNTQKMKEKRQDAIEQEVLMKNELESAKIVKKRLLKEHKWLESDSLDTWMSQFNSETNQSPARISKELKSLRSQKDKLDREINHTVMSTLDKLKSEVEELRKKRKQVQRSKASLDQAIEKLDIKKKDFLERAITKISESFSSIFSTLLPQADCKLDPIRDQNTNCFTGIDIKVKLGGMWKDNLTELSGGQRSLVALSLILAILKFKPAPIYILDEVDAALDLSHTQNIGQMIHKHFSNSQFLIISLKDGMFNNSNVLFKVKLESGSSVVTRTTNKS